MARPTEPRYTPLPGAGAPPKWAPEDAPQENRMQRPEDRKPPDLPTWHPEDAPPDPHLRRPEDTDSPRPRGRPAGEPTANVHLLVPVDLLARFDAKRGDVSRLAMIRRLMAAYLQEGA